MKVVTQAFLTKHLMKSMLFLSYCTWLNQFSISISLPTYPLLQVIWHHRSQEILSEDCVSKSWYFRVWASVVNPSRFSVCLSGPRAGMRWWSKEACWETCEGLRRTRIPRQFPSGEQNSGSACLIGQATSCSGSQESCPPCWHSWASSCPTEW